MLDSAGQRWSGLAETPKESRSEVSECPEYVKRMERPNERRPTKKGSISERGTQVSGA